MTTELDFERRWQAKLAAAIDNLAGHDVRARVMAGGEFLTDESDREDAIRWSVDAMNRLIRLVEAPVRRQVMTQCACHYPTQDLRKVRACFATTGDLQEAHRVLQAQFESFLRETMELEDELVEDIVAQGWGSAGILDGHTVYATKIPKSAYLRQYLAEPSRERRRELYCHCPRVREAIHRGIPLSPEYCYCGAGFYQDIWQTILAQPVEVELLESILMGDEVCRVAIHLPDPV